MELNLDADLNERLSSQYVALHLLRRSVFLLRNQLAEATRETSILRGMHEDRKDTDAREQIISDEMDRLGF